MMSIRPVASAVAVLWPLLLAVSGSGGLRAQQFQFMSSRQRPESVLPIEQKARGLAVGDLNGDGDRDVLACLEFWSQVFLRGPEGFLAGPLLGAQFGGAPAQVPVLTDIDGDGDADVVLGPGAGAADLAVFRSVATGLALIPTPMSFVPVHAFAVGDIDGDGDLDIVVSQVPTAPFAQGLLVLRQAFGGFQADVPALPPGMPAGTWPVFVDVDADGDADLVAIGAPGGFRLLRNTNGTFTDASASLPPTGSGQRFAVAGDFDGDHHGDVATLGANGSIDVLWSGATGFQFRAGAAGRGFDAIAAGDVDGDGNADLVGFDKGFTLLRSNGNRRFGAELRVGDDRPRTGQGLGDVDGDGRVDVLTAYAASRPVVRVAFGGGFYEDAASSLGLRPATDELCVAAPFAGDYDGDGRQDVLLVKASALDTQRSLGAGRYESRSSPVVIGQAEHSASVDFDGDGDLDVITVTQGSLDLWGNDGAARFTSRASFLLPSPSVAGDLLDHGDVDGDGDLDIVVATTSAVLLVRGNPGGTWAQPQTLRALQAANSVVCLELVDVDGDGDLDLATGEPFANGTLLLRNNGSGVFAPSPTALPFPNSVFAFTAVVTAGDVDGDGDADLVGADGFLGAASLLQNQGNGVFLDVSATNLPPGGRIFSVPTGLFVDDFDADGDRDIVFANGSATSHYLNVGAGVFLDRTTSRWGNLPATFPSTSARLSDFDGDGDLDVALENEPRGIVSNHLRQLVSVAAPRRGGTLTLDVYSGPGFGENGLHVLAIAPALAPRPVVIPGFRGQLELEPTTATVLAVATADIIGLAQIFVPVPNTAQLVGLDLFLQVATVPNVGAPGFGNCIVERVRG